MTKIFSIELNNSKSKDFIFIKLIIVLFLFLNKIDLENYLILINTYYLIKVNYGVLNKSNELNF